MNDVFESFIKRIYAATDIKNQSELADALGIRPASVSDAKRRGKIPPEWIFKLSDKYGLNTRWIGMGSGESHIDPLEGMSQADLDDGRKAGEDQDELDEEERSKFHPASGGEGINISEGRLMTDLVLMSGTQYAEALWSNLKSFAEAVRKEAQVKELERKVEAGFKQSNSEIAELKEMIRALGGAVPEKKSNVA